MICLSFEFYKCVINYICAKQKSCERNLKKWLSQHVIITYQILHTLSTYNIYQYSHVESKSHHGLGDKSREVRK